MAIPNALSRRARSCSRALQFLSVSLVAVLLAHVSLVFAEDAEPIKVCIPQHTASNALLHQVATTLSNHKPAKGGHTRVQGVELLGLDQILDTDNPFKGHLANQTLNSAARDRAHEQKCSYLLVISLPDAKTARSPQPNAWSPEQQSTTNTRDPYMRRQDPDVYVEVKYRLYRLDAAQTSTDGFVTTHEAAPEQAVVSHVLDMLANQIFTKVTK